MGAIGPGTDNPTIDPTAPPPCYVKNQPQLRQPFESVFENPLLEGTRYEYKPKDVFQAARTQAQKKPTPVQQAPQKPQVSPALERAITKVELEALYDHLGVPVKRATEEYGLKRLFGGKSPEQMKAAIEKLSTDAPNANATVRQLLGIFPNSTSGMSQATASSLWRTYMAEAMKGDADALKAMVNQDPKKPNAVPDMLREVVAERMKAAALRFVDQQVRDARGSW